MIDLDEYERRLEAEADASPDASEASGLMQAWNILQEMRSEQLPALDAPAMPVMQAAPTTQAMRRQAWPKSGSLRLQVVRLVAATGDHGFTDDDLERRLGRSHQSVSACRNGLVSDGWLQAALHDDGTRITRLTRFNNPAQVWVATPAALRRLAAA